MPRKYLIQTRRRRQTTRLTIKYVVWFDAVHDKLEVIRFKFPDNEADRPIAGFDCYTHGNQLVGTDAMEQHAHIDTKTHAFCITLKKGLYYFVCSLSEQRTTYLGFPFSNHAFVSREHIHNICLHPPLFRLQTPSYDSVSACVLHLF
jgi:hypothetical protein